MRRPLNIISIDGLDGIGKTTQIGLMTMTLKKNGMPFLTLHLSDTIDSALECSSKILKFLEENENGLVLLDGSIARMIVKDMNSGMSQPEVAEKYREVIFQYESISHKYGFGSILMVTDDIESCHKRLVKRGKLSKKEESGIEDFQKERDTVLGMRIFDTHTVTKSIKFEIFEIDTDDSMLSVQKEIWELLEDRFDFKKPSQE